MCAPGRTSVQLVFDKDFGRFFWGRLAVTTAYWAQTLVIATLTYEATGSAGWVGAVGAAQLVAQIVFALPMGKISDKYGPRPQIVTGALTCATSSLGLAIWLGVSEGTSDKTAVTPLFFASLLCGIGFAVSSPAVQSIVPRLVTSAELPAALGLNFIPMALGRTIGPAGGAALATAASPILALTVVGCAHLAFATAIAGLRSTGLEPESTAAADLRITRALGVVLQDRRLLVMLLSVALLGFGSEPAITLAPAVAADMHAGAGGAGQIASAFGVGSMFGVLAHRMLQGRVSASVEGWIGLYTLGSAVALVAAIPNLTLSLIALALGGAGMLVGVTGFGIVVQQSAPAAMLGRIMAIWLIAFAGIRPLAGLAQGLVADRLSTSSALALTAAIILGGTTTGIWSLRGNTSVCDARGAARSGTLSQDRLVEREQGTVL
jgi:hypothetical protein